MKTIHIVRHGKALQNFQYINDDDRPLTEKGICSNILVAKKFQEQFSVPDLIISSYAARALHTAHIFARTTGYPHEKVHANKNLYLHGDNETYNILANLPEKVDSVMIVGHNPDLTYVANKFGAQIDGICTSGVVSINFETDRWSEIENATAKYFFLDKS